MFPSVKINTSAAEVPARQFLRSRRHLSTLTLCYLEIITQSITFHTGLFLQESFNKMSVKIS